jgi:endoglucanase
MFFWNLKSIISRDAHIRVNEYQEGLDTLKWGADWLINAHPSENIFHGQMGSSDIDFDYFGPPEEYEIWAKANNLTSHKLVYTVREFVFHNDSTR